MFTINKLTFQVRIHTPKQQLSHNSCYTTATAADTQQPPQQLIHSIPHGSCLNYIFFESEYWDLVFKSLCLPPPPNLTMLMLQYRSPTVKQPFFILFLIGIFKCSQKFFLGLYVELKADKTKTEITMQTPPVTIRKKT